MNIKKNYILYSIHEKDISISVFLSSLLSIITNWTAYGLLRYEDENGVLNAERIWKRYTNEEKAEFEENISSFPEFLDLLKSNNQEYWEANPEEFPELWNLKRGTILSISKNKVNYQNIYAEGDSVVNQDYGLFVADRLKELINDKDYYPLQKDINLEENAFSQNLFPRYSIWIWSRTLFPDGENLLDVTPFINQVKTGVTNRGGTFDFQLPPLLAEYFSPKISALKWGGGNEKDDSNWIIKSNSYSIFQEKGVNHSLIESNLYKKDHITQNDFYFDRILMENDLVFIRFETLKSEEKDRKTFEDQIKLINPNELPGKIFDMIGLIDQVILQGSEKGGYSISIAGRDLMKLLIEDGTYFYPLDFIKKGIFANEDSEVAALRRDGELYGLFNQYYKTIEASLKFIFNALSNTKIVNENLLRGYATAGNLTKDSELLKKKKEFNSRFPDERSTRFYLNIYEYKKSLKEEGDLNKTLQNKREEIVKKIEEIQIVNNKTKTPLKTFGDFIEWIKITIFKGEQEFETFQKYIKNSNSPTSPLKKEYASSYEKEKWVWEKKIADTFYIPNKLYDQLHKRSYYEEIPKVGSQQEKDKKQIDDFEKTVAKQKKKYEKVKKIAHQQDSSPYKNIKKKQEKNPYLECLKKASDKLLSKRLSMKSEYELDNHWIDEDIERRLQKTSLYKRWENCKKKAFNWITNNKDLNEARKRAMQEDMNQQIEGTVPTDVVNQPTVSGKPLETQIEAAQNQKDVQDVERERKKYEEAKKTYEGAKAAYEKLYHPYHYPKMKWEDLKSKEKDLYSEGYNWYKIDLKAQVKAKKTYEEDLTQGIWQIVKIVLDDNIRSRVLVDNSIGNDKSNILSQVNKVCQAPFVEFFGDTYKDQYHFIARKLPFDKSSIQDAINKYGIIEIEKGEVNSENIMYYNGPVYSWYSLTPQGVINEIGEDVVLAYVPAIHFKEFAEIWGEKPLNVVTTYVPFSPLGMDVGNNFLLKQIVFDYKYLIESNAYLPFTRLGTITLNGDRRIKRGTWIRYKETKEIFYVDSVNQLGAINNSGVQRTTTLQLSRGLMEDHLESYFNIIRLGIGKDIFKSKASYNDYMKTMSEWKVNTNMLKFFMGRKQFKK